MKTDPSAAASALAARPATRPFQPDDAPAIREAMAAALERDELTGFARHHLEAQVRMMLADPHGTAVAEVDGRLAGWVIPDDNLLLVLPEHRRRGIGRLLVAAGRAIAAGAGSGRLRLWVPRQAGAEAFARACGLRHTSSLWQMRLAGDALAASPAPSFPDGLAVRSLRPGSDEGRLVALITEAFADHPGPIHLDESELRRVNAAPGFDPTMVCIVEDAASGDMVGFCRAVPYEAADGSPVGEIRMLGVRRDWRGRGLGRALTSWGVADLQRRGAATVVLAVEGANEHAVALYRKLGFACSVEWPHWTVAVSAADH